MTFIGCNIMGSYRQGSKIFQPFSGLGGEQCGFSTYYNGAEEVNVDFVYRAPARMDEDEITANTSVNLKGANWFLKMEANIVFSEQGNFDKYAKHISTIDTSTQIMLSFISSTQELGVFLRDSAANVLFNETYNLSGTELNEVMLNYTESTNNLDVFVDSVLVGSGTVTPIANFEFNKHLISHNDTGIEISTMLLTSYELTGLGKTSFVTNQGDGLVQISDNGTVWITTEDIAGSSQIKPDGTSSTAYSWPDDSKLYLPAVGYSQFDLTNVLSQSIATKVNIDFSAEWVMVIENLFVASDAVDDCQIVQWNDILGRTLTFVYDQTNRRFRCTVFDGTSNKTVNVGSLGTPIEYDTRYHVIIRSVGGTTAARPYEMEVVGYGGTNIDTDTLDFTPYTVQNTSFFNVGGVGKKYSGKIGNIRWVTPTGATYFDTFPLETRVPANTDPNVDDIVGLDNSSILEASVDRSYKFPYFGASQYLVEDVPCEGDAFLTSGGAFMLSTGVPMVRGAWDPGYTKTSFTGGNDVIVVCGDSNSDEDAFPGQTQWPELFAAYCATWLPNVTVKNIALSGLSVYGITKADYDRVSPNGYSPSLNLVGRPISAVANNIEQAVTQGATMIVIASGVATWSNSYTEGPYTAFEDIQAYIGMKTYLDGLGIKLIVTTPIAYESTNPVDAAGSNLMADQYRQQLITLGIDFIDENKVMRQGTDYIDSSFMRDGIHLGQTGQNYKNEYAVIPTFDRIYNMR